MKLNLAQIKNSTWGAVSVTEEKGKISFSRFTQEQAELYQNEKRHKATAGVRLCFKTDSKRLKMTGEAFESTSRTYFSFDIFVNGKLRDCIDNFSQIELPPKDPQVRLPLGGFGKEIALGDGEKEVCIYFPWSVCPVLEEVCLDDGAFIEPIRPEKKLLAFGDSITQGYDALRPSVRYTSLLADKLRAEEFNKGIGGEVFIPALAETKESFVPDYITVAYGTNDFSLREEADFKVRSRAFFVALSRNYPHSKILRSPPFGGVIIKAKEPSAPSRMWRGLSAPPLRILKMLP